jgi:hypothetical protein
VTFLESDGNLPAAVAAEVHRIAVVMWRRKTQVCLRRGRGSGDLRNGFLHDQRPIEKRNRR